MGSSDSPSPSPHALAHAPYRVFWGGSLISYTAQWVQQVALGFVVYDLTGSTLALGLVLGAPALPMLLLAPFSGVAADRYDRRHLLMGSQLVLVIATLAIGIASRSDASARCTSASSSY